MRILAIETSCDETAIAILECAGDDQSATFDILSHALISQIDIHQEFGGVYPAVAKREHAKNLVPLLQNALEEAELLHEGTQMLSEQVLTEAGEILARELDMAEAFIEFVTEVERPDIDAIAVTYGPGLEPALWVGVNFAQALAKVWNIPLVPVNHMEGHLLVALAQQPANDPRKGTEAPLTIQNVALPLLGLLISGGHTEIQLMDDWLSYKLLGQTRDDAVGEAFDKVARMMGLPYPGGPEIDRLAARAREDVSRESLVLPRPMIDSPDYDFSFSGLKTAVLYTIKKQPELAEATGDTIAKEDMARAFEDAVADVLVSKVSRALEQTHAQTLAIGGGVSANTYLTGRFKDKLESEFPYLDLRLPPTGLTGDNAVMIGIAGFYRANREEFVEPGTLAADGNLALSKKETT